jgi:CubicO group peptidase (beta-lactamase class C family)
MPLAVVLAAIMVLGGAPSDVHAGTDPWSQVPADRVAAECGLDPTLLRQANSRLPLIPFTVVRNGKLCWTNRDADTRSSYHVASVTKTFGAVLFGMIASRGDLDDTDRAADWIPAHAMGGIHRDAALAHVLAMTATKTSLATDEKGRWSYDALGWREINRLIGVMNLAIQREPHHFPGVSTVEQFAQRELFDVLGMRDSSWGGDNLAYSLRSSTQDLSRLGLLLLRKGNWNGRQLLEERYVYRMTHPAFEDTNTGYGYLTQLNAHAGQVYSSGSPDRECSPYATWPRHPHAPFAATTHDYGGSPYGDEKFDVGLAWAAGAGGQRVSVHRGLDLVIGVRNDLTNEGHQRVWEAIRPALVALDAEHPGDEAAFCAAYQRGQYAPTLLSPWSPEASR